MMIYDGVIKFESFFGVLWDLAITLVEIIGKAWNWLADDIKIEIPWFKLPVILPDGINLSLGFSALQLLGASLIVLLVFWVAKALIPFL